ncbi:MAG: hypothetical protein ACJAQ3_002544, partial [Planctomycetota bacterium]
AELQRVQARPLQHTADARDHVTVDAGDLA